jgi:hypothetical protein
VKYESENNSCEVCGEIPAIVVGINEYKRKGKDFEKPLLHYRCLKHILDIYNKIEREKIKL